MLALRAVAVFQAAFLITACSQSAHIATCEIQNQRYSVDSLRSVATEPMVLPAALVDAGGNARLCSLEDRKNAGTFLAIAAKAYQRAAQDYNFVNAHELAALASERSRWSAKEALKEKGLDENTRSELISMLHSK